MAVSQRTLHQFTFVLLCVSAIFVIVATAANYWTVLKVNSDFHQGLWRRCNGKTCFDVDDENLHATRILMVLSCVCYGFALAYCVLVHVVKNLSIKFLAAILFITCIFEVSGLSVYTDKIGSHAEYIYGWSYGLGWSSTIFTGIAACLCLVESGYNRL